MKANIFRAAFQCPSWSWLYGS